MTIKKRQNQIGISFAVLVALAQGLEGVLYQVFAFVFGLAFIATNHFGASVMAAKESLGLILAIIVLGPSVFKNVFKKIKSKQGFFYVIASGVGTAIGNLFYILAVANAGPGYGVILTALYPVFSMFIIKIFMKEKEPWLVWAGVFLTVVAGILFLILPALFDHNTSGFDWKVFAGMLLGMTAAAFWAFEGFYIKKGMTIATQEPDHLKFSDKEIIATRNIFSTFVTWAVVMPVCLVFGNTYHDFIKIFSHWQSFLIIAAIAISIVILRILHVKAIRLIGPKKTAVIDTNNFLVPALFAEALQFLPGTGFAEDSGLLVFEPIAWWSFFLIIPVIIGVVMVIYFHKQPSTDDLLDKHIITD